MKTSNDSSKSLGLIESAILEAVEALDAGEVVSFSDVANRAGWPRHARLAGRTLASFGETVPWWRVVYASGHLPPCNPSVQAERLIEEGVTLEGFRVVRSICGRFAK